MRGLATGSGLVPGSGGVGSFPNVAVYLDEQSAQLPDRNLDVYAADLERIEVLEGPQGTLFGAGAQAGVVRYITNKPKIDVTEGSVNAGYAITAHGDPSTNVDAMINVPLIDNTLALRGVIYNESRGGYINNIPGTFSREPTDRVVTNYFGGAVPPNSGSINNNSVAANAINPVVYKGMRGKLHHSRAGRLAYGTSPIFAPVAPPPGATSNNPNVRPSGDTFFDDITRGYKQKAAFGSVDFDVIPKKLTLTLGTRYYRIENFETGSDIGSFGCEIYGPYNGIAPPSPCTLPESFGYNLNAKNLDKTYSGFKSRANLTWHVTEDAMVYYTWSQGFRPGGFNRAAAFILTSSPLYGLFTPPLAYAPDTLTNNELGWKTEWLGRRVQWNGAVYQEDWHGTQIYIFDPGVTGGLAFTTNGPNYRVRGVETSLVTRVTQGLTVTASGAWNSSEVVKTLSLVNPATGQPINILNPFGARGSPLAQSPPFMGNIRIRDEFPIGEYKAFWQVGANRQGGSYATTDRITQTLQGVPVAFYDPGFTTYDASLGVAKGSWTAQLYGENLTDTRAILFSSYTEWVKANTINRPRTLGLRFSYKFTGNK